MTHNFDWLEIQIFEITINENRFVYIHATLSFCHRLFFSFLDGIIFCRLFKKRGE